MASTAEQRRKGREHAKSWRERNLERAKEGERRRAKRQRERHPGRSEAWRKANPDRAKELRRAAQQRKYAIIRAAKEGKACANCGRDDLPPWALDFHHVRGRKRFNVGRWYDTAKWRPKRRKNESVADAIRAEIKKCDVICPTCHRLEHPPSNT